MKFGNGCWLQKEGIECFAPQEAYFVNKNDHEVVICVQTSHYLGVEDHSPKFDLNMDENRAMDVEETEDEILVRSGNLSLRINKKNWSMSYERDGKVLTASSGRDLAYMRTQWTGFAYDMDPEGKAYMRQQLGIDVNEHVYGLGERFGALVRNGQSVDIWNEDGGTSTDQSYKKSWKISVLK